MVNATLSRGACPYCGAASRPNSLHCLVCGQVVQLSAPERPLARPVTWSAPAPPEAPASLPVMETGFARPPQLAGGASSEQQPLRRDARARPALPPVQTSSFAGGVTLHFSTGQRALIGGSAVIGRLPDDIARNSGRQGVAVADDSRSLSRAHAFVDLGPEGVFASDAGSANGSQLERDGVKRRLQTDPVPLRDGDRLWLGDIFADVSFGGA